MTKNTHFGSILYMGFQKSRFLAFFDQITYDIWSLFLKKIIKKCQKKVHILRAFSKKSIFGVFWYLTSIVVGDGGCLKSQKSQKIRKKWHKKGTYFGIGFEILCKKVKKMTFFQKNWKKIINFKKLIKFEKK